ncbi:MAG: AEC family transporter [Oscillospiraceae bacterium]|nr:AEC family transporter [Oscillospiraceae bacterium]
MQSALVISYQTVIMFILLAVGYFLYRGKLLGDEATQQLSNIAISIINPIVIFNAYQREFVPQMFRGLIFALILGFLAQGILVLPGLIIVRKTHRDFEVERFALGYSNCAFMGIPLVQASFGAEGVFYLTAFITAFNVFMWTHGVILMSGKKLSGKGLLKIALSPAILAIVLGLVCFFTGLRLPGMIQQPLDYLGAMNTPLAMLVSGATIAKSGLLGAFKSRRVYFIQTFKLMIVPALLTVLFVPAEIFGVSSVIVRTILIAAAAPTASATIMFAYKYGKNTETASHHFALSTVLGILSMPLIMFLTGALEGLMIL